MILLSILEMLGTIAFAASGALTGIQKGLDLFGILCLSITTSIGGGLIRDVLLNNLPPVALKNPLYCIIAIIVTIFTCIFHKKIVRISKVILIVDAIGLGVFTALGANTALQKGADTLYTVIFAAVITGIGGGILRDVFVKDIPYVFRKEIYAVASMIGAFILYYTYNYFPHVISLCICFIITFTVRLIAIKYELNLPVVKSHKDNM